jgi:hypothetical protein
MIWWDEVRAALGTGTVWRRLTNGLPRATLAGGLAWLPLAGAAVGGLAAIGAAGGSAVSRLAGAFVGVACLEALSGRVLTTTGGVAAAVKVLGLIGNPTWTWTLPLVLAPMLGRWAVVVQCYGGAPAAESGPASLVGRARFREFGWASVTAIGAALVSAEAFGLIVVLSAALLTLGVRMLAYRRARGLTLADLARTDTLVEAAVLGVPAVVNVVLLATGRR